MVLLKNKDGMYNCHKRKDLVSEIAIMMKPRAKLAYQALLSLPIIILLIVSCTELHVTESPVAQFDLDRETVEVGQTIQFNDQSMGDIVAWSWDFGDNTTSTEQNPLHAYSQTGNYTIILTVSNKAGSNSTSSIVNVIEPLVAEFSASNTKVLIGEMIKFTDESTGDIDERLWDFGDNTTSMQWRPEHSYDATGVYTVSLKVSNAYSSDTITKQDHILVSALSVKTVFSSHFKESGEYTPDEELHLGEDIWVIYEVTGFEQRETEGGYEVWLKAQHAKADIYEILDSKGDLESHEIHPLPLGNFSFAFYMGNYDVDYEPDTTLGVIVGIIQVTIEDVLGGFTVTDRRAYLIKK